MKHDAIVTVACFNDEFDANLARIQIEGAGIECFLADTNIVSINWLYANAAHGIKLNVRASDAQQAQQILSEKKLMEKEQPDENDLKCPSCGSEDIKLSGPSKGWAYLSILFFNFPITLRKNTNKCNACGHTWEDEKSNGI